MEKQVIKIRASDVAKVIGVNPYESQEDVLPAILKQNKISFEKLPQHILIKARQISKARYIINSAKQVSKIISTESTEEREEQIQVLKKELQTENIPDDILERVLTSKVNMSRGTRDENKVVEAVEEEIYDNNAKIYRMDIETSNFIFRIAGKIDGRIKNQNAIVEIKNRQRRLFKELREYEKAQLQCYLKMTGATYCKLIENFQGETWKLDVEPDEIWWSEIMMVGLEEFGELLIESI